MPKTKIIITKKPIGPPVSPVATSRTTPATVGDPGTASAATVAVLPLVMQSTAPPNLDIPAPPSTFRPVNAADYRGFWPKQAQIIAAPGAAQELMTSTTFASVFGPTVPQGADLGTKLTYAAEWSAIRLAVETLLAYVKSGEIVAWKAALVDLQPVDAMSKVLLARTPGVLDAFPALVNLLNVQKVLGQRAQASRTRNAKAAKTPAAPPATGATAAPAVILPPVGSTGNAGGGVTH